MVSVAGVFATIGLIAGGASPRRIWATASEELLIESRL